MLELDETAFIAGTRFGLGLSPDDPDRMGGAPGRWLMRQIESPRIRSEAFAGLTPTAANLAYSMSKRKELKQTEKGDDNGPRKEFQKGQRKIYLDEIRARLKHAVTTDTPFYERLVDFWSNHFTVSMKKGEIASIVGSYEREAIRPFVTGRFVDMLMAVAHHPVMLAYLDNFQSVGPNSVAGRKRGKGLNENLAREIMELHTLGVNGGYTQTDVTTFAKVITGWSIARPDSDRSVAGRPGSFEFVEKRHEPGTQRILGRMYADDGEAQGIAVLRDLAAHPATAQHIATKLARHFIADEPPPEAVAQLADAFQKSGGNLPAVYQVLLGLPQAWDMRGNPKIKSTYDLVVSAARTLNRSGDDYIDYCLKSLQFLGELPFSANSPAGLPDIARDIAGPEAMIRRVEWAQMAAVRFKPDGISDFLTLRALGPYAGSATASAIKDAHDGREATAILLGSPEFQRR